MARDAGVSLATVQLWCARAGDRPLAEVDFSDHPSIPQRPTRTAGDLEDLVLGIRRELREQSVLGEYGAAAIAMLLAERRPAEHQPSIRTIGRILERRGALDGRRRVRRPPPPAGWYLPPVAARATELDSFDAIVSIRLLGGADLDVLTGISLHGGLVGVWPEIGLSSAKTVVALTEHWRAVGLPGYAQFDNDARFTGTHRYPDAIGPVVRLCLAAQVVPVFVPPYEMGFQAAIEAFNGRWQRKVWTRRWMSTLESVRERSDAYVAESRRRHAVRIEAAPARAPYPDAELDLRAPLHGRMVFIRRTNDAGAATVLGRSFQVDPRWLHRLVRGELDIDARVLRFFALRRREPDNQPLLAEAAYPAPARWFR